MRRHLPKKIYSLQNVVNTCHYVGSTCDNLGVNLGRLPHNLMKLRLVPWKPRHCNAAHQDIYISETQVISQAPFRPSGLSQAQVNTRGLMSSIPLNAARNPSLNPYNPLTRHL